jgi:1-acyl-sn-glycerol-3-phosphate acyltransferase
LLKTLCGLQHVVEGRENIPPGTHVSMWKHSSAWETIAQAAIFPPQAWVLKRELMWIPLVGWAVSCLKPIAINRKAGATAVTQVIEQGTQRLRQGLWILVFPEGTRVAVGETRKYGVSGALLASRAGCKIVPGCAQRGLLLAASRLGEEAWRHSRGDWPADRSGGPRSTRAQRRSARVDRASDRRHRARQLIKTFSLPASAR